MSIAANAAADRIALTTSLPGAHTSLTLCGWACIVSDLGGGFQPLVNVHAESDSYAPLYLGWDEGANLMQVGCYASGGFTTANFGSRPATGVPFFWYVKSASTTGAGNLKAGWRQADSNTWNTQSTTLHTSGAISRIDFGGDAYGQYSDIRIWNIKVWTRELSTDELNAESFYERAVFPTSLHFHWRLRTTSDVNDRSGNGRNATTAGTLATADEDAGLWVPRAYIPLPVSSSAVTGTLAQTEANDTLAGTGYVAPIGSLAQTEANDTSAASGSVVFTGTLAQTEANDTSAASGSVVFTGTLAQTEADDTSAASGSVVFTGTVAQTEANDTSAATGAVVFTGTLAQTEANDTLNASGVVGDGVVGTVAVTEADDTSAASGSIVFLGTLARTEDNDTLSASGAVVGAVTGTVAATEADDTLSATGLIPITGTVAVTEENDTLAATGIGGPLGGGYWSDRERRTRELLELVRAIEQAEIEALFKLAA